MLRAFWTRDGFYVGLFDGLTNVEEWILSEFGLNAQFRIKESGQKLIVKIKGIGILESDGFVNTNQCPPPSLN